MKKVWIGVILGNVIWEFVSIKFDWVYVCKFLCINNLYFIVLSVGFVKFVFFFIVYKVSILKLVYCLINLSYRILILSLDKYLNVCRYIFKDIRL